VLLPLIPARLHGWLDELVSLTYVAGALALSLEGAALATALAGAAVHFALTRVTDYPRGAFKLDPLVKTLRPEEAGVRAVRGA
jgi:hypothetical protein